MLWLFIGVESVFVVVGVVKNLKCNVFIVIIGGVLIVVVCYVFFTIVIMGMIFNVVLCVFVLPFGDVVWMVLGDIVGVIVFFCVVVGCLGLLGGWMLLVG